MTTDSPPPESSKPLTDAEKNKQLEEAMKKIQATIDSLQKEVTTLRKDKSTGHTRSTNTTKKTLQSVAPRLDMNDGEDEAPPEEDAKNGSLTLHSPRQRPVQEVVSGVLQRCLNKTEASSLLQDVHEGECGNHTTAKNLSLKVLRTG